MTASDAMRELFKAIGEYARATRNAGRPPVLDVPQEPSEARMKFKDCRVIYTPHASGFTIDGSRRPGDPTSPGDQNSGAFLGLESGHALACLKAWADKAGMEFDESLGFEGNLTQWFIDLGNFTEGR